MQRALMAGVLLLAAVSGGRAEEKTEYALTGAGTLNCTQFANEYRDAPRFTEILFFHWAQGFMSGLNAKQLSENGTSVNLNAMTTDDQQRAIRSYCNAHPLASYVEAVEDLFGRFPPAKPVTSTGAK